MSFPFFPAGRGTAVIDLPALLATAAARAAASPTGIAQTRLPLLIAPVAVAFDGAVAAALAMWRGERSRRSDGPSG